MSRVSQSVSILKSKVKVTNQVQFRLGDGIASRAGGAGLGRSKTAVETASGRVERSPTMAARLRFLSTLPPPPIPPLLDRVFERMYMLRAGGGVVGVVGVGGVGLYYLYKYPERTMLGGNENIVLRAFEEGRGLNSFQGKDGLATVQRSELRKGLLELLHPASSEQYAVIVGGTGTGKSTAVRQALQSLKKPVGALYFMTPETIDTFSTEPV